MGKNINRLQPPVLLHHFGSSTGMRDALASKMTTELIVDMTGALRENVDAGELIARLFASLSERGHAKLLAWRAVEESDQSQALEQAEQLFAGLLQTTQDAMGYDNLEEVRRVILLVAAAAVGYAVAGQVLPQVLGMSAEELDQFPAWLADHLG